MTLRTYTLEAPPVLENPPGHNGRASPPAPDASAPPRRPAPDPWDVRGVKRLNSWSPWRVAWWVAKDLIWDAEANYRQVRSLLLAVLGARVSRGTQADRLETCGTCPHKVRRESTYDPVSALADGIALAGYGLLAAEFSPLGWYIVAAGSIRAVLGVLCVPEGASEFCGRCGCGQYSLSELQSYSRFESARCPINAGAWET